MITRDHQVPVTRQCQILELSRSTAYYQPRLVSDADLALMRRIDELHLECPFAGARLLRDLLRRDGHTVGRKDVATRMEHMGWQRENQQRIHLKYSGRCSNEWGHFCKRSHVLRVEEEVCACGCKRTAPPPAAGGGEWAVETAGRRFLGRQAHPVGGPPKKSLRLARRRYLAEWFQATFQVSCLGPVA